LIQEIATGVLPVLIVLSVLVVLVLAAVLPPSALVSYIVARRATRRLEMLAAATGALRAGDYSVRVPVLGEDEDEVARLQANFNAMAADLERAMHDLQAERDTVTALSEARRELVASVSHELRTPVTTVRGYLESNRTRWETTPPPTLQQDMDVMLRETIRLQRLIDDLFALAQVEGGSLALRCSPTAVGEVAQQCVTAAAPLAWQRDRVQILAEVDPATPPALVDAGRLEQVLYNLLRNAVRHTPPGGIVVVVVSPTAGGVQVQVQDTGAGIAPEDLPHIWERFYRAQATRTQDTAGAGLGLALVKELTEAMGGRVGVSSELGMGSCFSVWLPCAGPVPSKVGAAAS
jgi:signal transduction histidine kinase